MSVCPSAWKTGLPPDGFSLTLIFMSFSKICQKNSKFHSNRTRITDTLHEDLCTFMLTYRSVLKMRLFQVKVVEKIKTHILCSRNFFSEKCADCEKMLKEYGRPGQARDYNIIQRMRFECWITKATDTQSEYVILLIFPLELWFGNSPQCCIICALLLFLHVVCMQAQRGNKIYFKRYSWMWLYSRDVLWS